MQEIEKLRADLDEIQAELVSLFRRRLVITQKIWRIKKSTDLALSDLPREHAMIHRFDAEISEEIEQTAVQNFSKNILSETKKYLEAKLK